jgi:hypothetical protein
MRRSLDPQNSGGGLTPEGTFIQVDRAARRDSLASIRLRLPYLVFVCRGFGRIAAGKINHRDVPGHRAGEAFPDSRPDCEEGPECLTR